MNNGGGNCQAAAMTSEDLYLERKECADNLALTKELYETKLSNLRELSTAFFDAYKRDVDGNFGLYKNQRDIADGINQRITDTSFGLYKNQRDEKDDLLAKINEVNNKVDMMSAVRPYQDALINAKIDNVALVADFNLARRTCKMIQGTLVLPSSDAITGYPSSYYCYNPSPSPVSGATS